MDGVNKTLEVMEKLEMAWCLRTWWIMICFTVSRNDSVGYARALEEFDRRLPEIISKLKEDDACDYRDHGCDPPQKH